MPQITLPIELPAIDLGTIVPIVALVVLAALILLTLTARTLIKSRAFTVVMIAVVVVLGSSTIVGGLQSIALLIGVAGAVTIGLVIVLGRTPDVLDVVRTVANKPSVPPSQNVIDAPRQTYRLPAAGQTAQRTARRTSAKIPRGWL